MEMTDTNTASGAADLSLQKRVIFDAIRSAYDLGYSDARNARSTPGDSAPGYKGRQVEADHGGALSARIAALASAPAQPAINLNCKSVQKRLATQLAERKPLDAVTAMRLVLEVDMHSNHTRGTTNWAVAITRAIEHAHDISEKGDSHE